MKTQIPIPSMLSLALSGGFVSAKDDARRPPNMQRNRSCWWCIAAGGLAMVWLAATCPDARAQAGNVDPSFAPALEGFGSVRALALEPGGQVLAAGFFGTGADTRALIRLESSGAADPAFHAFPGWGVVLAVARQPDGKILIGGFDGGGVLSGRIARLNPDGMPDPTFNPGIGVGDNFVNVIVVQTNGQILIAGAFQSVAGVPRTNIARLNANGSLDAGFLPPPTLSGRIDAVAIQPDGKILTAGFISAFRGVARLNANGSRDNTFVPAIEATAYAGALALQPDGKIILGGNVPVAGANRGIVRLNSNGSIDPDFNPGTGLAGRSNEFVTTLALQPDGKILVGGFFYQFSGVSADHLVRLNTNGTPDVNYDPGTFNDTAEPTGSFGSIPVQALAVQADGRALVAGSFVSLADVERRGLVRLLGGENPGYAGRLRFSAARYSISETGGMASIAVLRTRSSNGVATVNFEASIGTRADLNDGPATAGLDFLAQAGSLTFTQGQTVVVFTVPILDDNLGEPMESLALTLSQSSGGAVLGRPGIAALSILENDSAFEFGIGADSVSESAGAFEVWVLREGILSGTASVQYATASGTATAGVDFGLQSGTLMFASGQSFVRLSIPIIDDSVVEGAETFSLILSNPSPGVFLNPRSNLVVTITDNDDNGPGSLAPGFNPTLTGDSSDVSVYAMAARPDGDLVIAGNFTRVNGLARKGLARLNADGSLDNSFNPDPALSGRAGVIAVAPDESVLLGGGYFTASDDFRRDGLVRLRGDGALDTNFVAGIEPGGQVFALARAALGRWLVAGSFHEAGGAGRTGLARFAADGTFDTSFNPVLASQSSSPWVGWVVIQEDGRIVIVGYFTSVNGVRREGLARLNADGSLDESFDAVGVAHFGVTALATQPDGKVLLGLDPGSFSGQNKYGLVRLNTDGSFDNNWAPVQLGHPWETFGRWIITHLAVQPDGRIVVTGNFGLLDGLPRFAVGRIHADGSVDPAFDFGRSFYDWTINALALEAGGDVWLGGVFRPVSGPSRSLVRLRGQNADFLGRFEFNASTLKVWETNAVATLSVRRHGGAPGPASVRYAVSSGTASNGVDYVLAPGTLEFATGETSKTITVTILGDLLVEPPESFTLTLSSPVDAVLGSLTNATVTILDHPGGVLDESFDPGSGPDNWIFSLLWLPGEKILARGQFMSVNGLPRRYLARFKPDGSLDESFDAGLDSQVISCAAGGDGKVYVCSGVGLGGFVTRLSVDGSVDPTFQTRSPFSNLSGYSSAPAMAVQADGRLLLAWSYSGSFNGSTAPSNRLMRLNSDGSSDLSFRPNLEVSNTNLLAPGAASITGLHLQEDGKILVRGYFTSIGGVPRGNLARLYPDGSVDSTFSADVSGISQIALQPDGKILIGGSFTNINGLPANFVARLRSDGTLDPSFVSPFDAAIYSRASDVVVQPDGRILVAGDFSINRFVVGRVLRLQPTGALDRTFDPAFEVGDFVYSLLFQGDGKVITAGSFNRVNGIPRRFLARLLNDSDVGAGRLEFSAPAVTIQEQGSASLTLTVRRTVANRGAITVNYGAGGGTATPGADFAETLGVLRFEDGDTADKTFSVQLHDDLVAEGNETFSVQLVNPIGGATLGEPAAVQVTVLDNDTELEFVETDLYVRENGLLQIVEVRRLGSTSGMVSVDLATRDGTAQGNRDYLPQNCTATFADGETNYFFSIPILDDGVAEADETLEVMLSNPGGGARLGTNRTARLTITDNDRPGTLDLRFDPTDSLRSVGTFQGFTAQVEALAVQSDRRILVAGSFADPAAHPVGVLRLLPDGSMDWSFAPGGWSNGVVAVRDGQRLALQSNGQVLVASAGFPPLLLRLTSDGSLDESFRCSIDRPVNALAVQPDGKVVIGGEFTRVNDVARLGIARLNGDGSLDTTFDVGTGVFFDFDGQELLPGAVDALLLRGDGRLLVGGRFNSVNGVARVGLAQLTATGTTDVNFDLGSGLTNAVDGGDYAFVTALAGQPDGRVLVAGCFTHVNGVARTNLVRLQPAGSVDAGFVPAGLLCLYGFSGLISPGSTLVLQPDGRMLVSGYFGDENAWTRLGLARLHADGSLDEDFAPVLNPSGSSWRPVVVHALAVESDGQILVGGTFDSVENIVRPGLARLNGGVFHFEFHSLARLINGRVRLNFAMPRGQSWFLQASVDLVHWLDLNGAHPLRDSTDFTDFMATGVERRFYRALQAP